MIYNFNLSRIKTLNAEHNKARKGVDKYEQPRKQIEQKQQ